MRALWIYYVFLVFIYGCSLFRQTTTSTDEASFNAAQLIKIKAAGEHEQSSTTQTLRLEKDSANAFYNVRLWPKGKLLFSPENGFNGEFDSVQMTGYSNKLSEKADHSTVNKVQRENYIVDMRKKFNQNSAAFHQVKKSFPGYFWIVAGLVLMVIVVFWVRKAINQHAK